MSYLYTVDFMKIFTKNLSPDFVSNTTSRKIFWLFHIVASVALIFLMQSTWIQSSIPSAFISLLLVILLTNIVLTTLKMLIIAAYRKRNKIENLETDNFIIGIRKLGNLVWFLVIVSSLFPIFNIPFLPFLTSLSVFSVAFAWLFKEYIINFFDGFRLMFSPDLRIGDYIKVNDSAKGIITDITLRDTKIKTDDGDLLLIPNTNLMSTEIINFSKVRFKRICVNFQIPLDKIKDVSALEKNLTSTAMEALPDSIDTSRIFLRLITIEQNHVHCAFEVSIDEYSFSAEDILQRSILDAVISWTH